MEVFVARQPIFDENMKVIAYELLYRESEKNFFNPDMDSSKATSILLVNSYFSIGMEKLTEDTMAFVNFDKNLIESGIPLMFDKGKIVIEILEDVIPDRTFIRKIKNIKNQGYMVALDDFLHDCPHKELIDEVDILKVDFMKNTRYEIQEIAKRYSGGKKYLLAEKVETREDFNYAKKLGFTSFQGYFFSKPLIVRGKKININRINYVRLFEELSKEEPCYINLSKIVEIDAVMSYKLLRLINSKFSFVGEVKSIKHALTILGLEETKRWVSLVMVQDLSVDKPKIILKTAIFRSKFGELISLASSYSCMRYEITLMGLMSILDTILGVPLREALGYLPLSENITRGLLRGEGVLGTINELIQNYEKGDWDRVNSLAEELGIDRNILPKIYFNAIEWTDELFNYMKEI